MLLVNYKLLYTLPLVGVGLGIAPQIANAMFKNDLDFFKNLESSSTWTSNPGTRPLTSSTLTARGGSSISSKSSKLPVQTSSSLGTGLKTTTSTTTSTPSPKPSLNVRPKTSTSSNLQTQSPNSYDDPSSMNPFSQLILQSISNGASATEVANTIVDMTFPISKVNLMKNHYERMLLGKATSKIINNDNNSSLPHLLSNSIISKIQIKAMEKNPLFALELTE